MKMHEPYQLLARAQALAVSFDNASPVAIGLIRRRTGGSDQRLVDFAGNEGHRAGARSEHRRSPQGINAIFDKEPRRV